MAKIRVKLLYFIFGIILVLAILFGYFYSKYPIAYGEEVKGYSQKYNIEQSLIFAIIKNESNFNINAVSNKGAMGLMQIMPSTAKFILDYTNENDVKSRCDFNKNRVNNIKLSNKQDIEYDLKSPIDNIMIGTMYLRYLMDKYKNDKLMVLTAYNAGEGILDKWINEKTVKNSTTDSKFNIDDIKYKETRNYVEKVLKDQFYYEKLYNL